MVQNEIKLNSSRSWMQFIIVFLVGITIASGMFKVPVNMPNIMELGPPAFLVHFRAKYWPMAMKMTSGSR